MGCITFQIPFLVKHPLEQMIGSDQYKRSVCSDDKSLSKTSIEIHSNLTSKKLKSLLIMKIPLRIEL